MTSLAATIKSQHLTSHTSMWAVRSAAQASRILRVATPQIRAHSALRALAAQRNVVRRFASANGGATTTACTHLAKQQS
jgi:hypothetical protein